MDWESSSESQGSVVGIGCCESAFLFQSTPSIRSFSDPDLPALMLFMQYLTQLEGPLWRQIRGQGFAYSYSLAPRAHEGLLYFTLYRATNVVAAYRETKAIVVGSDKSIIYKYLSIIYYIQTGGTTGTECRLGYDTVGVRKELADFRSYRAREEHRRCGRSGVTFEFQASTG